MVLDTADKPGVRDRANFDLHWSVDYWQNFTLPPAIEVSSSGPIPSRCVHASEDPLPNAGSPEPRCHSPINGRNGIEASMPWMPWLLSAISCTHHGATDYRAAARLACWWQATRVPPVLQQQCLRTHCESLSCRLQAIVKTLSDAASTAGVFSSSKAAAYWSYHITRSGFFAIQGIAGAPLLSSLQPRA